MSRPLGFFIGLGLACISWNGCAVAETPSREQELAMAQDRRAAGDRMRALALCEDVLQRWPGDAKAQRLQIQLLSEMGAAGQAEYLARQLSEPLPPEDMAKLQADLAAHQTRWARAMPADTRQPYLEADRAVATEDHAIGEYGQLPGMVERLGTDRLIAYEQATLSRPAVRDYDAMQKAGSRLPPYAELSVADALLQQRRPEQAIPLYESGIKYEPGPYPDDQTDPRVELMYAYFEAGRERRAMAWIDQSSAKEPIWLPRPGSTLPRSNRHKAEEDLNAALIRDYTWQYREAWERIEGMRAQAPMDAALWRALAKVERDRGWPRRAEDTLVAAAGIDPDDTQTRLEAIDSWRDLNDFARVEPALRDLESIAPRDSHVQTTRQDWDRQRGWQFDLEYDRGKGGTSTFGDYDHETQATLQSPLLDDFWRVYGITRFAGASLEEGHAERDRAGLGLRAYVRDLEAYVQALPGFGSKSPGTALEAGLKWSPSDYWNFGADWSNKGDVDVPLRASYYRVTAHSLDVNAEWRASEMTSVKLTGSHDSFSDGNHRNGWQLEGVQRLYTATFFTFDGGVQLGTSRNQLTTVPYYSPARARWGMLTGRLENLLYQRYESAWRQRIDVAVGPYQERFYGQSWAASVRYGQIFKPRGGLAFGWGLSWNSQPYDGRREARVMLDLTMHWGE